MTASVHRLADRLRSLTPDRQIAAIAHDVDEVRHDTEALGVLARQSGEAQRATGDAVSALADAMERGLATQRDHGKELADLGAAVVRVESAVSDVAAAVGKAPDLKALARASSLDLSPEEIAKAELGSGLHRIVAEARIDLASVKRQIAAAGFATAAGATLLPAIFAALPGTAQIASGVVLALIAGLAGLWARKKTPQLPPKEGYQ